MLLSAMSLLVVAQSSSETPEGLMNNPIHEVRVYYDVFEGLQIANQMFAICCRRLQKNHFLKRLALKNVPQD